MTSTLPQGPYGFIPVRSHAGGFAPRADAAYNVASGAGTIYAGDLVATTGTGRNIQQLAAAPAGGARGVFRGVQYTDNFGNTVFQKVWLSGTPVNANFPILAYVYDDPTIIFKAQTGNGNLANTSLNAFFSHGGAANGSSLTGVSGEFVDVGTHSGSSANKSLFALNLTQIPGNDYSGFTELEVMLARPELQPGAFVATGS